jgi:hypothetical protein
LWQRDQSGTVQPVLVRRSWRARPVLERLEDRTAPAAAGLLGFTPGSGLLAVNDPAGTMAAQVSLSATGYVQVMLDGVMHSSNPGAADYDTALAGAGARSLHALDFQGSAQAALVLDGNTVPGNLAIVSDQPVSVTGHVGAGGTLSISAPSLVVLAGGSLTAPTAQLSTDVLTLEGTISASSPTGGSVSIQTGAMIQSGAVTADGSAGAGGSILVDFSRSYIASSASLLQADGATVGGRVVVNGGSSGRLYTSGSAVADGMHGGTVELLGQAVILAAGSVDSSGTDGGGTAIIGGTHAGLAGVAPAQTVTITSATVIHADALQTGNGGQVRVWSTQKTDFAGTATATGGAVSGAGGIVELSSAGTLNDNGQAGAGAAHGVAGRLLLDPQNLVISAAAGAFPQFDLLDPGNGTDFGNITVALSNGNIVVTDPTDSTAASQAGAVYLFNGETGALISTLTGSKPNDQVGSGGQFGGGVLALGNGNFVVASPQWGNNVGAVTWASGNTGISGVVSAANSLVGSSAGDNIGSLFIDADIQALSNGNYVVISPQWNGNRGAVTWGNGSTGTSGVVSAANSLVGTNAGDQVGNQSTTGIITSPTSAVTPLNNGNYVVESPNWNAGVGAATWGNGNTGISGTISAANSLVGASTGDQVGSSVTALSNGNYVVTSPNWNGKSGAATWGDGSTGTDGMVSSSNSLVGPVGLDQVGSGGVTALTNGNYVVDSPAWGNLQVHLIGGGSFGVLIQTLGAATWGNGTIRTSGSVTNANSLTGSTKGDQVGSGGVAALRNGNYVVDSDNWSNNIGAVTWGNGSTGTGGTVADSNSLVGQNPGDYVGYDGITPLSNGNYVVGSSLWNGDIGAATWANGSAATTGIVSANNSITGSSKYDQVGGFGPVVALTNGNYVVSSNQWHGGAGAATWANGNGPVHEVVGPANSLVGTNSVAGAFPDQVGEIVIALANGNYVLDSPGWAGGLGAVTWGDGSTGISGEVSVANSLVGFSPGIGDLGVRTLSNDNYVVFSVNLKDGTAAATWVNGLTGQTSDGNNIIDTQNSVLGTNSNPDFGFGPEDTTYHTFLAPFSGDNPNGAVVIAPIDPTFLTFGFAAGHDQNMSPNYLAHALANGTNVTLQASNDITINDPITVNSGGAGGSLTLQSGRSILINASISTGNGNLTMIANDTVMDGVVDADRKPGAAVVTMAPGASIDAGAGQVSITLVDDPADGKTNAASGAITLQAIHAGALQVVNSGLSPGSDIDLDGAIDTGTGAQSYEDANGVILPNGTGLGTMPLTGHVSFAGPSALAVTINGTEASSQYAQVQAMTSSTGAINLTNLALTVNFGYTPTIGDRWTLIRAGAVTGRFLQGSYLFVDNRWLQIVYGPTSVDLVYITTPQVTIAPVAVGGQAVAVGTALAPLQVLVTDSAGNPVSGETVAFTATAGANGATAAIAGGGTAVTNAQGIATAPAVTAGDSAGTYTVSASVAGAGSPAVFTLANLAGAAADIIAVGGMSQATPVGSTYGVMLQAKVTDAFGNPVANVPVTFTVPGSGPGGVFNALPTVLTTALGIATAPAFTANTTAGSFTVSAMVAGVAAPAVFNLTSVSGPAAGLVPSAGNLQSVVVHKAYPTALAVQVVDQFGNPVQESGVTVTFTVVPSGKAGGSFLGKTSVITNAQGIATAPTLKANTHAGSFTVSARASGLTAATFNLDSGASVAADPVVSGSQRARVGQLYAKPLEATVHDAFGNPVGGVAVTFTAPTSGPGGNFAGQTSVTVFTDADGVAIAPAFTANRRAGSFVLIVTANGLKKPARIHLTNLA